MLKIGKNKNIDLKELIKDSAKYRITFISDFAYSFDDPELMMDLDVAYHLDDKEKFKNVFNEYAENQSLSYKIKKIFNMSGPGGNWPVIEFETTKPMTIKQLIKCLADEFFGDEEEVIFHCFGENGNYNINVTEVIDE